MIGPCISGASPSCARFTLFSRCSPSKTIRKKILLGCPNFTLDDQEWQNLGAKFSASLSSACLSNGVGAFHSDALKSVKAGRESWRARGFKVTVRGNSASAGGTKTPLRFVREGRATSAESFFYSQANSTCPTACDQSPCPTSSRNELIGQLVIILYAEFAWHELSQ